MIPADDDSKTTIIRQHDRGDDSLKVSITEAAKLAKISRGYLYQKYITPGLISISRDTPDKPMIDTAELYRVFGDIKLPDSPLSARKQDMTHELSAKITSLDTELTAARQQLSIYQEREKWLQGTVDKLTDTIRLLEHKPQAPPYQDQATLAMLEQEKMNSQALQRRMADLERVVVEQGEARSKSDKERAEANEAAQRAVSEVIRLAEELETEKHISILTKFLDNIMRRKR